MRSGGKQARCRRIGIACIVSLCAAFALWNQQGVPHAAGQDVKASPLEESIRIMHESRKAYADVRDYTCTLVKRESLPTNPDDNIIMMKFRGAPYSVYMRWLSPSKFKGQEVAYMHGRNRNKLRVHAKGLIKGLAGFVSVDVNDSRITEHSRHNIYEAGIGFLIEKSIQHWEADHKNGKAEAKVEEYEFNKRRCWRIEVTQKERRTDVYCYRTVLFIDQESKLPVRNENYSWPRAGGPADGDLIEMFSFIDLRVNVGLTDRDFDK